MGERLSSTPAPFALTLAAILTLALPGSAGSASAAGTGKVPWAKPWAARILTPRPAGPVTGRTVRVAVKLGPGVKRFRAWIGDAPVTGAFDSRPAGTIRSATLRVGRTPGLGFGRRILYVETSAGPGRHWWAERHIVVARRGKGLLKKLTAKRVPGSGANVRVVTRSAKTRAALRVDGGGWRPLPGKGRRRSLHLDGDIGLRPGVNRVVVRAVEDGAGRYQTVRARIVMPRTVPVAGAGAGRRARMGAAVRFDGTGTSGLDGKRLRYRWRIVRKPAGSKARLRRAGTMKPVLRPDLIGHYVLRLTVTGAGRRGAHASALASAVGKESPEEGGGSDSDTATLDTIPAAGAIGVPVDTITPGGIAVGNATYAAPSPADALQMLVLERATLAKVSNVSYTNDDSGTAALLAAVEKLTGGDLVIVTKPRAATNNATDSTANGNINKALGKIGVRAASQTVTNGTTQCETAEPCSGFSAIGVPGIPIGQGWLNDGLSGLQAPTRGDLHGYFQENLNREGFTFVSTERVPFDTGEATANPAVVSIGSDEPGSPFALHTFTSDTLPSGSAGFFVLVLASGNLGVYSQNTYTDDASGLAAMHATLSGALGERKELVIVRSIGAVERVNTSAWDQVAEDLQKLGASKYYFNQLNGTSSSVWAQVSPAGDPAATTYPDPDMQYANHERTGTGRLTGLLARNDLGQLYPKESLPALEEPKSPLAGTLPGIMSLPAAAWPEASWTPGEIAVEECIADHIAGKQIGELRTPIRSNYANSNYAPLWAGWEAKISAQGYLETLMQNKGCEGLKESDFKVVREQLETEWTAVPAVWKLIENMQDALRTADKGEEVRSVALEVVRSVSGNASKQARYDTDSIASDALWALSTVPGFATESDAINFLAAGLGLASDLQQHGNGSSAAQAEAAAVEFASKLSEQTTDEYNYLNREAEILVGDPAKLVDAARNGLDTKDAAADWSWEGPQSQGAVKTLMEAVRRQSYLSLVPSAYALFRLQGGASSLPANAADYQCSTYYNRTWIVWNPFGTVQQQYGFINATTSAAGAGEVWVYALPETGPLSQHGKTIGTASESLLTGIFGPAPEGDPYQSAGTALFDGVEFAIEAYGNGTENTITVTHTPGGSGKQSSNYVCESNGG